MSSHTVTHRDPATTFVPGMRYLCPHTGANCGPGMGWCAKCEGGE